MDGVGKSFLKLLHCIARTLCNVPGSVVAVKLEENEAELFNPDPLSISNKPLTIKSESGERDLAIPDLEDGELPEGELDGDYVDSEDDAPKPIVMSLLKSAGKRPRPFAPPERSAKKKTKVDVVAQYVALLMK